MRVIIIFLAIYISSAGSKQVSHTIDVHDILRKEPYDVVFLEENDELVVTCGQDGVDIKNIKLFQRIENNSTEVENPLTLKFHSTKNNDNIVFCDAKSSTTDERMTGVVRLLTVLNKAFYNKWQSCNADHYCHNNGQCYRDPENPSTRACVCSSFFGGPKCDIMVAGGPHVYVTVPQHKPVTDANIATFAIFIIILTLCFCAASVVAFYYYWNHRKEKKLRGHLICSKCNTQRCEIKEDETQTADGNLRVQHNKETYESIPQNVP